MDHRRIRGIDQSRQQGRPDQNPTKTIFSEAMSTLSINQKINLRGLVEEFPRIGKKEFLERFRRLKIGSTGQFVSTFQVDSALKGDYTVVLTIRYEYYGDFVHYGVGKGIGRQDNAVRRLVGSGRKAKPWKKGVSHMKYRLGELYAELSGRDMSEKVLNMIASQKNNKPILLFDKKG